MNTKAIHLKEHFPILGENECDPTLTIYVQQNMIEMGRAEQKRPAVLVCPGGGYSHVSQREAEPIALNLLPAGYNVFILNYSVAPNTFPTQLREVAAAMEMIHANAEQWHVDISRICIMGFSAGGHLAGHYTNCYDFPEVRQVFPESKAVYASILCYPVITADPQYRHLGSIQNLTGHGIPTEDDIEKFSLDKRVSERTPPTFLWHTVPDKSVSVMNSILYAKALAEHKRPFSLHIYPQGGHGLSTADEQTRDQVTPGETHTADWMDALKKWLKLTL